MPVTKMNDIPSRCASRVSRPVANVYILAIALIQILTSRLSGSLNNAGFRANLIRRRVGSFTPFVIPELASKCRA